MFGMQLLDDDSDGLTESAAAPSPSKSPFGPRPGSRSPVALAAAGSPAGQCNKKVAFAVGPQRGADSPDRGAATMPAGVDHLPLGQLEATELLNKIGMGEIVSERQSSEG